MQFGLFTADNIILQTLLFFMTYSVVYSIVVVIYEDIIIRETNVSVGLVALFLKSACECIIDIISRLICLPSYLCIWSDPEIEGGREDCKNFFGGLLMIAVAGIIIVGVIGGVFFGINYLLVDAGAGHYCKVWTI
jgi:hypothetical protein